MKNIIKQTFNCNYIKTNLITDDISKYLDEILSEYPNFKSKKNVIYAILNDIDFNDYTCIKCGKKFNFNKNNRTKICPVCRMKITQKSEECKEKIRKTCLEKYGVDHPWKSEKIKEKIKNTNLKKYGFEHSSQNDKIKSKQIKTCQERYGKNSPTQVKEIKDKQVKTTLEKYKVKNYFQKYSKSEEFKELRKEQFWKTIKSWSKYLIPLFEKCDLDKIRSNKVYKWKCVKCGNEFESHIHKTMHIEEFPYLPRCLNCYPYLSGYSNLEKELVDFCKQYFPNLECHNSQLIKPYELDIVINELKLCFEFNGSFWHSLNAWKLKHNDTINYCNYHLNKVIKCNEKGYRLIHIWEDEWNSNKDLIKQKLIDIFEGKEIIDYSKPLDRSWYNNLEGEFKELPPEIIIRNGFEVENCGYLVYIRNKNI